PSRRLGPAKHDIPGKIHRDSGKFEANREAGRAKMKENATAMPLISSILSNVSCAIQAFVSQIIQTVRPVC
ncbi:MAG: hypothetical protein IJH25_11185, partial [Clostridia bacterium]|nr:hypothetical protein [Clostridia bacterium]